jgi:protein-L-isoaspartate(D-aspartate) O-methyltransferase
MQEIQPDPYSSLRHAMARLQLEARGIRGPVLDVMARVPRHEFVPERYRSQAYEDRPLPIGNEQTISQPYIVALTVAALELGASQSILEVGTGSGYQTAVLCELAGHVYSIERHKKLAESAQENLVRLGYNNATIVHGDGSLGLPEYAPYNAIVVSAAARSIPRPLLDQLQEQGRMVIPVGPSDAQQLQLVRKIAGEVRIETLEDCRFVPLIAD